MGTVTKTIIVGAPIDRVFAFWRDFENFPRFMDHIESVQIVGPDESHWKMKGPFGSAMEWDAKTTSIEENHKIAWQSTGGQIQTHGAVVFKPHGPDATEVTVGLAYRLAGGVLSEALAKLFADPEDQLQADLIRFKRMAEEYGLGSYDPGSSMPGDDSDSFDGIPENADAESIAGE